MNPTPLARFGLAATAWALAASALAATPANAAELTRTDGRDNPAHLDLQRIDVDNGANKLIIKLQLRDFERKQTNAYAVFGPPNNAIKYAAGWGRVKRGQASSTLFMRLRGVEDATPVQCVGDRIRVNKPKSRVIISIPQRCLRTDAGPLRVGALTETRTFSDVDDIRPRRVERG